MLSVGLPLLIIESPFLLAEKMMERKGGVESAIFTPDGDNLLITHREGSYQHLYRVAVDGSLCEPLTHGKRFDFAPAYSPDGTRIVFSSALKKRGRNFNLFVMNADGSDLMQLTEGDSQDLGARFSPDGKKIIFSSSSDRHQADICIVNVDGTELKNLTHGEEHDISPVFMGEGENILFERADWFGHYSPIASSDWHNYDFYSISQEGTGLAKLTAKSYYRFGSVSTSPDGKLAAFQIDSYYQENIHIVSLDGSPRVMPLSPQGKGYSVLDSNSRLLSERRYPRFSPDGKSILFAMTAAPGELESYAPFELHIMELETHDTRQITNLYLHIEEPRYSPDGKQIVFLVDPTPFSRRSRYELWVVNSDGSALRRILLPMDIVAYG